MKKNYCIQTFLFILLVAGCNSSQIIVSWKKNSFPSSHTRIMVAGVIKGSNDSLRQQMEKKLAYDLKDLGYDAVSAYEEFGPGGLSNLGQAETYLTLCNKGIDALMVVALLDQAKEKKFRTHKSYTYPDNYYYERIWNYKNILADIEDTQKNGGKFFWETILFNLSTLEAECTIQTPSFSRLQASEQSQNFEKKVIQKMVREKILKRQKSKRPF